MMTPPWENLTDGIFHHAETRPDAKAVIQGRRDVTYREFATLIGKAAVMLRERGVDPGSRVGVCLVNSLDHLILSAALLRVGAVMVEVPPRLTTPQRTALAQKLGLMALSVEPDAEPTGSVRNVKIGASWLAEVEKRSGDWRYDGKDENLRFMVLSSGSTGISKGINTTHRQYLERCRLLRETFPDRDIASGKRPGTFVLTLGLSAAASLQHAWIQFMVGGAVVVLPEYQWIADLIRGIAEWEDAICFATPGMCRGFIASANEPGVMFPKMRALLAAGTPLTADEKRNILERVSPNFYELYGTGAVGRISVLTPAEIPAKGGSVGRPIAGVEVEIVDAAGNRLGPNTAGFLRCRSAALSTGFENEIDQGGSHEGFRGGWYYPGDRALIDADGYIYLRGRGADLIVRRGVDILPWEIEAAIGSHPTVAEVVVVGRPSREIGEEVIAFVLPRVQSAPGELEAYCNARLPAEKIPRRIVMVQDLPRTANGKPDRARLQQFAADYAVQHGLT